MDGTRFDALTKRLVVRTPTRRGLLRLGLGGGLGVLAFGQAAEVALACRRTGKPCAKGNQTKQNRSCCSGTCKKGTCRPTPGAAGCQVNSGDVCQTSMLTPCPHKPDGFCVLLDSGKPFCADVGFCEPCASHADCTDEPGGKCLKTCPLCTNSNGRGCFYPQP